MCGIAGFVGSDPTPDARIDETLRRMAHRGPDHAAHRRWELPGGGIVDLLHTRLSIIDLDPRSNQPFQVGSKWMAYNGELYNYLEVREALAAEGESFHTESDTEVMLAALHRWGWDGLDRCEGMWAFATYDERDGSFGLCRDRFGEKPLYLFRDERGLYFGSEAKFIFSLLGRTPPVNRRHLQRYLVNGYKSLYKTRETFFEGLEELEAGAVLHLRDGEESVERYWTPPVPQAQEMSFQEATAGARERLIRSVELRLRADVPLAFCMSGGVDSLSLISIAREVFDYDVHGFTIVNSDARYEEQDMVDHAVERLGVRHTPLPLDTSDFLPKLAHARAPSRRPGLHDHLLRAVAAHGADREGRLPGLRERHGRGRALQRLLRPPPRLPARGPGRPRAGSGLARRLAGACGARRAKPVPLEPRPVRRRP